MALIKCYSSVTPTLSLFLYLICYILQFNTLLFYLPFLCSYTVFVSWFVLFRLPLHYNLQSIKNLSTECSFLFASLRGFTFSLHSHFVFFYSLYKYFQFLFAALLNTIFLFSPRQIVSHDVIRWNINSLGLLKKAIYNC